MALQDDLRSEVKQIFDEQWLVQNTQGVPDPDQLRLNNHAKDLEQATVLYADLDGSTNMVESRAWQLSAEVYKVYLRCSARIITSEDGVITAYDGDRVMAIFTGVSKNTNAVRAAFKINFAVLHIINPLLRERTKDTGFNVKHVVGIDTSQLRAARIGVRGNNDLVWVGRAANYAAKLTNLSESPLWITQSVYDNMNQIVKETSGRNMWENRLWTAMNGMSIYRSNWHWGSA